MTLRNFKLWIICISYFLCSNVLGEGVNLPKEVRRPPSITYQTPAVKKVVPGFQIVLNCTADALPKVDIIDGYVWKKDGVLLNTTSFSDNLNQNDTNIIIMSSVDGSIAFKGSNKLADVDLKKHEGVYQCFASNQWGTAISDRIKLKVGTIAPYQPPADKTIIVREGQSQQMPCDYSDASEQKPEWKFIPEDVKLSPRIAMTVDGGIVFSNVIRSEDADLIFFCTVRYLQTRSSRDGPHYTMKFTNEKPIRNSPPVIIEPTETEKEIIALKGEDFKLQCIATGKPTSEIIWDRIGQPNTFELDDFNRTILIRNISYDHEGKYRCRAYNDIDSDYRVVKVVVQARPYFESGAHRPINILKLPGEDAVVTCSPSGIPKPRVQWYFNGEQIDQDSNMLNGTKYIDGERIVLKNLKDVDTGVYQCLATNTHGETMAQGFLNVLTSPPTVINGNSVNYRAIMDRSIKINCKMFAFPKADYSWFKNGNKIPLNKKKYRLTRHNSLHIESPSLDDAGEYTCTAVNDYGQKSINMSLEVFSKTRIAAKTKFYVHKDKDVNMSVLVQYDERLTEPIITWYKDRFEVGKGSTLGLLSVGTEDSGRYIVEGVTELDKVRIFVDLIVQDRPERVGDVRFVINESDPYRGTISWRPPLDNFSPITDYKIEFEEDRYNPSKWKDLKHISGTEASTTLPLQPWVRYSFRVWAKNEVGWSLLPSLPTDRQETKAAAPNVNPKTVTTEGDAPSSLLVSWSPVHVLKRNGPGFGYKISWKTGENENSTWINDENANSFRITSSRPYMEHGISVQSGNDLGLGPKPDIIIGYSGEDLPLKPPTDIDISSYPSEADRITVKWQPPPSSSVRGLIKNYIITLAYNDTDTGIENSKEYLVPAQDLIKEIFDLLPYTNYSVTLSVKNTAGESPKSYSVCHSTPESIPSAPRNLKVIKKGMTSLSLKWEEPKNKNGIILQYKLIYTAISPPKNISEEKKKTGNIIIYTEEAELKDLIPSTTYNIVVKAFTSKGYSIKSLLRNITTADQTGPPLKIFNVSTDYTEANVTWFAELENKAEFYIVQHKLYNKDERWTSSDKIFANEFNSYIYTVEDLSPDTEYYFRIVAQNKYGQTKTNPAVHRTSNNDKAIAGGGLLSQLWILPVLLAVLLILIIFLIYIICRRRRKGGKYSVSENEKQLVKLEPVPVHQDDKPIESDNIDGGNGTTKENGLIASGKRGSSVGGNSIEAFGSGDTRDYDENASFVGEYGPDGHVDEKPEENFTNVENEQENRLLTSGGDAV